MTVTPIKHGSVHFKKCDLVKNRLLLGIDCGSSLAKVVFLHKDNSPLSLADDTDFVTLTYAIFNNKDFEGVMEFVRDQAYLDENTQNYVHITGNINNNKKDIIESIFGLKTEYVDETLATIAGHRIALEQIGLEALAAAPVNVQSYGKFSGDMIEKYVDCMSSKFKKEGSESGDSNSSIFPCVINVVNSSSELYYFDKDGKAEQIGYSRHGGQSFLGLTKCLLDTNDYDEVIRMASKGDRARVDTQVKDVMIDVPNSPYGTFPPDLPIFPFGKCMDQNIALVNYGKEDVALSLIGFYSFCMILDSVQICQLKGTPKVFLSGNIFRSNLFQKEITRTTMTFSYGIQMEILDSAYCVALGAMLCHNRDKNKYWKD